MIKETFHTNHTIKCLPIIMLEFMIQFFNHKQLERVNFKYSLAHYMNTHCRNMRCSPSLDATSSFLFLSKFNFCSSIINMIFLVETNIVLIYVIHYLTSLWYLFPEQKLVPSRNLFLMGTASTSSITRDIILNIKIISSNVNLCNI